MRLMGILLFVLPQQQHKKQARKPGIPIHGPLHGQHDVLPPGNEIKTKLFIVLTSSVYLVTGLQLLHYSVGLVFGLVHV